MYILYFFDRTGFEGSEQPAVCATKGSTQSRAENLDDFLSERGELTQRVSRMRTNEVSKSSRSDQHLVFKRT